MLSGILTAFLCLALFILAVVGRFHFPPVGHRLQVMIGIWTLLLPVYVALYFGVRAALPAWLGCPLPWQDPKGLAAFLNGALLYALLFFAWCYCYFCADHSLSVLYMMALEDTPARRMTLDDLKKAFPYEKLLGQRQGGEFGGDRLGRGIGQCGAVGDQDGLRRLIVLRLRQQIERDAARIVGRAGKYDDLGWPGDRV